MDLPNSHQEEEIHGETKQTISGTAVFSSLGELAIYTLGGVGPAYEVFISLPGKACEQSQGNRSFIPMPSPHSMWHRR